jgi:hypothetical protein
MSVFLRTVWSATFVNMAASMTQAILLTVYALVALMFLDTTYREGQTGVRRGWDAMRVTGLVYCLAWPLLILHIVIVAYRDRHAR